VIVSKAPETSSSKAEEKPMKEIPKDETPEQRRIRERREKSQQKSKLEDKVSICSLTFMFLTKFLIESP